MRRRATATVRSTSRCSPTACVPSASRASRSTWPTATSPRRHGASSSPTRPGHAQYTRNMVTGASNADIAIVLVDARHGVVEQTRRHAFISSLLGVHAIALAVNKMDLVDFDEAVFDVIVKELSEYVDGLPTPVPVIAFPISALLGDNVVDASPEHAVVRRSGVAGLARAGRRGDRWRRGHSPRRAAGHPAAGLGLPRLRRSAGRWPVGHRRRDHRAAERAHLHGRRPAALRPRRHLRVGRRCDHRGAHRRRRRRPWRRARARRRVGHRERGRACVLDDRPSVAPRQPVVVQARHPCGAGLRRRDRLASRPGHARAPRGATSCR